MHEKPYEDYDKFMKSIGERPYVLWIGALISHKNPLQLIEIARSLPSIEFVMIGSPFDASILDQVVRDKPSNLHYLGPVLDETKNQLIRLSSAGITTSKYEGFGWVPFEFLTAGKPVLAYPLIVFQEIYGDLVLYANNVGGFIDILTKLKKQKFKVQIDCTKVAQLQERWNLTRVGSTLVKRFNMHSLAIFTFDYPPNSNIILGCDIVNWKIWKNISEKKVQLQIFTNGTKYSNALRLNTQTIRVGRHLEFLQQLKKEMKKSSWINNDFVLSETESYGLKKISAKLIDLILLILEPASYAFAYVKHQNKNRPQYIMASRTPEILAALIVKFLFRVKLICLIHDADFFDLNLPKASFPMKVYYLSFIRCLRHVDYIVAGSRTTVESLSRIFPHPDRLTLLWGEETG